MTEAAGYHELAMLASLAGRVERQLLRALRLELAPHLCAADEADLWFSPVVESAGETGLVFKPDALPKLQRRLAEDRYRRLELAWDLIFRLRTGAPYSERDALKHSTWLLVQEELTYWGVRGGATSDEDVRRIATLCAWVVNSRADATLADDAGAWIKSARLRLPLASWGLPGAEEMRMAAQSLSRPRRLFVRRVVEGVELSEQTLDSAHPISTSAPAGPMRVEVVSRGESAAAPQAALVGKGVALIATTAPRVDLILSDGQRFALDLVEAGPQVADFVELARRTVLIGLRRGHLNGVLLTSDYVLTCAHGAEHWSRLETIAIQRLGDLSESETRSPSRLRATPVASSPLTRLAPLPSPFGPEADDLALLRLRARSEHDSLAEPLVIDLVQPVLGLKVIAFVGRPALEFSSTPSFLNGDVIGVDLRGFVVAFREAGDLEAGSSGAPVWTQDGRLLGLIRAMGSDRRTLVAPVRSLASLLAGTPLRVLVAGSGTKDHLPENVWRPAEALGRALARAGHVLVCGGWPGVDHIVARAFSAATGDRAALASRFVQLVETGSSPDLQSSVAPIHLDPSVWDEQMSASADAMVALGGLGGTYRIGRAALDDGQIVLPIPETGGDARRLYEEARSGTNRRSFPDRRALRILEVETATPEAAETVADRALELLDLCYGKNIAIYRRTAAAVYKLFYIGVPDESEASSYRREIEEAAGEFLYLYGGDDPSRFLPELLPEGAIWLIRDLMRIEADFSGESAREGKMALLDALLANAKATDKLASMLAAQPDATGQALRAWRVLASADEGLGVKLDALDARIAAVERRRVALTELRDLARKFLAPVDMITFDASYRELERETHARAAYVDSEFAARLLTSDEATDRVIGYVVFWLKPTADLTPTLAASLQIERREAFERHETRPLWLVLECIEAAARDEALARRLPPQMESLAFEFLLAMKETSDVDPGRECTRRLERIVTRLRSDRTKVRFATYSRFVGERDGRRRYAWCVFVDAPPSRLDDIREVEYTLDPTFARSVRMIDDAAHGFPVMSEGWGEFTLKIRVFYKSDVVSSLTQRLELKVDAWPRGPLYSGPRDELATRIYAALGDPRWEWRRETALARETATDPKTARAALGDLARGGYVRNASQPSAKGVELWGATARVGALPGPSN